MEKFSSYIVAIVGIVGIMIIWALVQQLWKIIFADDISDVDALAERRSCGTGSCGCSGTEKSQCKTKVKTRKLTRY